MFKEKLSITAIVFFLYNLNVSISNTHWNFSLVKNTHACIDAWDDPWACRPEPEELENLKADFFLDPFTIDRIKYDTNNINIYLDKPIQASKNRRNVRDCSFSTINLKNKKENINILLKSLSLSHTKKIAILIPDICDAGLINAGIRTIENPGGYGVVPADLIDENKYSGKEFETAWSYVSYNKTKNSIEIDNLSRSNNNCTLKSSDIHQGDKIISFIESNKNENIILEYEITCSTKNSGNKTGIKRISGKSILIN